MRVTAASEAYEVELLVLQEVNADGRHKSTVLYDAADRTAALRDLEERYAAQHPTNAAVRHFQRLSDLLSSGHAEDIRSIVSADAATDDRRRGMRHLEVGRDAVVEGFMATARVGARHIDIEPIAVRGVRLALLRTRYVGSWFEIEHLTIIALDAAGDGRLAVLFDLDDMAAALAELDRLAREQGVLENFAVRRHRAWESQARRTGDWGAHPPDVFHPEFLFDDRRTGLQDRMDSGAEARAAFPVTMNVGMDDMAFEPIAVRGELLVLFRCVATYQGFESVFLLAYEDDGTGRAVRIAVFDHDDVRSALAFLDQRYATADGASDYPIGAVRSASTDAAQAALLRPILDSTSAYNRRDWADFRSHYRADVVVVDHRPASWGLIQGIEALIQTLTTMLAVVPDLTLSHTVMAVSTATALFSGGVNNPERSGGNIELAFHLLYRVEAGKIATLEIFPSDAVDAAWNRYWESLAP
jgi:hypothetical protein